MDQLRQEARAVLQRDPWKRPDFLRAAFTATAKNGLADLWQDVSSHDSDSHLDVRPESISYSTMMILTLSTGLRKSLHSFLLRGWLGHTSAKW